MPQDNDLVQILRAKLEDSPHDWDTLLMLGELLIEDDPGDAKRLLIEASRLNPNLERAFNLRGVIHRREGAFILAKEAFDQALDINPRSAEVLNNLGNLYRSVHNYPLALECFQKAADIAPDLLEAKSNRIATYVQSGNRWVAEPLVEELASSMVLDIQAFLFAADFYTEGIKYEIALK